MDVRFFKKYILLYKLPNNNDFWIITSSDNKNKLVDFIDNIYNSQDIYILIYIKVSFSELYEKFKNFSKFDTNIPYKIIYYTDSFT